MNSEVQPDQGPSFIEFAWNGFDGLHVLKTLLSRKTEFFGQNEILFAALGAWIVAPNDDKLRQAAIIRTVRQKLVKIEASGRAKAGSHLVIADICERLMKPGIAAFYEQVYYPIGGLRTITGPLSRSDFLTFYRDNTGKVETALEIAEIYHYHSVHLSSKEKYRPASLNAAAPLIKDIGGANQREGGDADDNIKKQWRASRRSISLAYAASRMRFQKESSHSDLLNVMQSGDKALRTPADVLSKLIGRARFFEETVLSKAYKNVGEGIDLSGLGVEPISMRGPSFGEDERRKIERKFARYPKIG